MTAQLEHLNYTVADPDKTALWMTEVFGWKVRWKGGSIDNGYSVHVGTEESYVALYAAENVSPSKENHYTTAGGLNHVAVTVDDLAATEKRARAQGLRIGNHFDYEPGQRFYFYDNDGIEYEVVQYD